MALLFLFFKANKQLGERNARTEKENQQFDLQNAAPGQDETIM